jgi:hypothetical protein
MKRVIPAISLVLTTIVLAATVFAAGGAAGKVTKVEGDKVTVTLEGAVPAYVKKGATVSVLDCTPKVLSVNGKEVTLKVSKAKAATIKVDSKASMSKASAEMQGC